MKIALIRYIIFLVIGLPLQWLLIMPIYFILYPFWYCWFFLNLPLKRKPKHEVIDVEAIYSHDYGILINDDDHGAFTQYADCTSQGLLQFVDYKSDTDRWLNFLRTPKYDKTDSRMYNEVSGDTVISFCFAAVLPDPQTNKQRMYDPAVKKAILELAKSYLIFLGTRSFDKKNNGHVSARCNNFGINWCPDGWGQLGQPMFGPNFYTSSALFALAANFSRFWKVVFWLHWWVLGGWFWAIMPAMYPRNGLWYTRDMLIKALFVHQIVFGKRW
ncbi:MAG: hypothetical protein RML94_15640, partial [Bacteroidia bacterium]|nr:hypothetical protein [Bacteroidia bacterium]